MKPPFEVRLKRLRSALGEARLDGMVMVPGPNLRYFTGVDSFLMERPFVLLVPSDGEAHLVAPELESGPYRRGPLPLQVHSWTDSKGPSSALKEGTKVVRKGSDWGVEGRVPFLFLHRLTRSAEFHASDGEPILQGLREVKDEREVGLLKESSRILGSAFLEVPDLLEEGISEIELQRKLADLIYSKGASRVDDLLVQSGPRTADPHSGASDRKIRRGESIILDLGSTLEGYHSDVTRTFCIGGSKELERVYDEVLEANLRGRRASKAGATVGSVDGAARGHLQGAGLGRYFTHRTGHGLGLEVHEAPYIVQGGDEKLRNAMFFTVEPGAYLPGKMGARVEDDLTIEGGRGKTITEIPREFGWWR